MSNPFLYIGLHLLQALEAEFNRGYQTALLQMYYKSVYLRILIA